MTWSRAYQDDESRETYTRLHSLTAAESATLVSALRDRLGVGGRPLREGDVILDIPPRDKDRLPEVTVYHPHGRGGGSYTSLAESSRIVSGMGEDFLAAVKKIRLFVHPEHADRLGRDRAALKGAVDEGLSTI